MSLLSITDNFFISARSVWLAPGRGFAVFAGVFLATVVLIAILAYGVALGQVAMQDTIKNVSYDGLIHFKNEPGYAPGSRTDSADSFSDICGDFVQESEFMDCGLIFARQGFYPDAYPSRNVFEPEAFARAMSQDIRVESFEKNEIQGDIASNNRQQVPPNQQTDSDNGNAMFLSRDAIDGPLGDIYEREVVDGEWFRGEFETTKFKAVVPQRFASIANLSVGDSFNLSYSFVSSSHERGGQVEMQGVNECVSLFDTNITYIAEESYWEITKDFCRQVVEIESVTVIAIYKPSGDNWRDNGLNQRILLTTESLDQTQTDILMQSDNAALALKLDRSLIPSNSTTDAQTWLTNLEERMEGTPSNPIGYYGIEINYEDRITNLLADISIFVILVQVVDYVLMIPVIVLSLAVLIYGLNLALEQRRSEIAIHRLYGGTASALRGLILSEVFIISAIAWVLGYVLGIAFANFIANAVGFMEFEKGEYELSGKTSLIPTLGVFAVTVGLGMIIAWVKTRRFLSMEIEEGIRKEEKPKRSKFFLLINIIFLLIGFATIAISFINPKLSVTTVLLYVLGPFALWIGGAVIMARLSGYGPKLTVFLLGKTRILSDVRIGIRGSELNRTMNQLGLIVVLTISIVTMAVFQGYTGSLVDERSASASVGADIQIELSQPISEQALNDLLDSAIAKIDIRDNLLDVVVTSIRLVSDIEVEGSRSIITAAVLSPNHREVLHWNDQVVQGGLKTLSRLPNQGFTSGADAARNLDLAVQAESGINDILSPFDETDSEDGSGPGFSSLDLVYPRTSAFGDYINSESPRTFTSEQAADEWMETKRSEFEANQKTLTVDYLGGHKWIPGIPQNLSSESILLTESALQDLKGGAADEARLWFIEFCDEKTSECSDTLQNLSSQMELNSSVLSVQDWATAYDEVKRNGGLIFGTPGILSLQYIVAAFATLASSLVFLSLVLARRRRELAILQSIGASVTQLSRLVVFEIISVFTLSLVLGGLLGLGLAQTFTGLFSLLGAFFQLFMESEVIVARELVWPWAQILTVNGLVFALVFVALLLTTVRAVKSDLPTVLKEE